MAREVADPVATGERRLTMTYEEWLDWTDEDVHSEWVDGEVTVFVSASDRHQAVLGFLHILVAIFVWRRDLGVVRLAPFEMRLPRSAREPDLLFIARDNFDRRTPQRLIGPADLVVELVSDDSVRRDRDEKLRDYAAAGVPEYLIVDPRPGREDEVFYRLDANGVYKAVPLDAEGRYHFESLPGFWLDPAWLRQDPLPNPEALLALIDPRP